MCESVSVWMPGRDSHWRCNWFKVDAISPVALKGGLKKISLEGRRER